MIRKAVRTKMMTQEQFNDCTSRVKNHLFVNISLSKKRYLTKVFSNMHNQGKSRTERTYLYFTITAVYVRRHLNGSVRNREGLTYMSQPKLFWAHGLSYHRNRITTGQCSQYTYALTLVNLRCPMCKCSNYRKLAPIP